MSEEAIKTEDAIKAEDAVKTTEAKVSRKLRKVMIGVVSSDKMDKSIVVEVNRRATHPLYKKVVKVTSKYYAHDENNEARVGDTVKIMETRPLSKLKRWRLVSIEQRAVSNN